MLYHEGPHFQPRPKASRARRSPDCYVPVSVALMAVIDPERHSAPLVKDGTYTHRELWVKETKKGRLETAYFVGTTEKDDGKTYGTTINVTFPGIFSRGLARLKGKEPQAPKIVDYPDYPKEYLESLDLDDPSYLDHPLDDSEEPEL